MALWHFSFRIKSEKTKIKPSGKTQKVPTSPLLKAPTVFELAFLAAQLVPKDEPYSISRGMDYVHMAADLWEWSQMRVEKIEKEIAEAISKKAARSKIKIPLPKSFPIYLNEFLKLTMPRFTIKKREEIYWEYISAKLWREYQLTEQYQGSGGLSNTGNEGPTKQAIDRVVSGNHSLLINKSSFEDDYIQFKNWFQGYKSKMLSERGRIANAAMKANKKAAQNTVDSVSGKKPV